MWGCGLSNLPGLEKKGKGKMARYRSQTQTASVRNVNARRLLSAPRTALGALEKAEF